MYNSSWFGLYAKIFNYNLNCLLDNQQICCEQSILYLDWYFEVFVNKYGIFEYDIEMQILIAQPSRFLIFFILKLENTLKHYRAHWDDTECNFKVFWIWFEATFFSQHPLTGKLKNTEQRNAF